MGSSGFFDQLNEFSLPFPDVRLFLKHPVNDHEARLVEQTQLDLMEDYRGQQGSLYVHGLKELLLSVTKHCSFGNHGVASHGWEGELAYRVDGEDLSIVTCCAYYWQELGSRRLTICHSCLQLVQFTLQPSSMRAKIHLLSKFERLFKLGDLAIEDLAEIVSTLFPFYTMPDTPMADARAAELQKKIDETRAVGNQANYLRMIALETTKYQVLCTINNQDWQALDLNDRNFCEKIYVWGKVRMAWRVYHAMFTSIIDYWCQGLPVWGSIDYKPLKQIFIDADRLHDDMNKRVLVGLLRQWLYETGKGNRLLAMLIVHERQHAVNMVCSGFKLASLPLDSFLVNAFKTGYGTYRIHCKNSSWLKIIERVKDGAYGEVGRSLKRITNLFHVSCQVDYKFTSIFPGQVILSSLISIMELKSELHRGDALQKMMKHAKDCLHQHTVGWSSHNFVAYFLGTMENNLTLSRSLYERQWMLRHLPFEVYNALGKEITTIIRAYHVLPSGQHLTADEVAASVNFESGTGRYVHHSDVGLETANRCNGPKHLSVKVLKDGNFEMPGEEDWGNEDYDEEFYEEFRSVTKPIMSKLLDRRQASQSLKTFLMRRHEWVSSGSATDSTIRVDGEDVRGNKRTWAEKWKAEDMLRVLKTKEPREIASGSEKHENDKPRALYAPDAENFCTNSYTTVGVEARLKLIPGIEKGLSGTDLVACEVQRCLYTMLKEVWVTCADYKDFNRQHTNRAMAIIFEELREAAEKSRVHPDYIWACDWTARCQDNRFFNFIGMACKDITLKHADQRMFSGTRATDILNTICNIAYKAVAAREVRRLYGLEPIAEYAIHQGDDVWLANRNVTYAVALVAVLMRMGLAMQPTKQLFTSNTGEFLRVQYAQGRSKGLLFRALVNIILRPLQSTRSFDPESNVKANCSSIATLQRRGLSLAAARTLWTHLVNKARVVYLDEKKENNFLVPYTTIVMPTLLGGYECAPPGTFYDALMAPIKAPAVSRTPEVLTEAEAPSHMSSEWVEWLS